MNIAGELLAVGARHAGGLLAAGVKQRPSSPGPLMPRSTANGVAVVEIVGPLVKGGWPGAVDSVELRRLLGSLAEDANLKAVCLVIESPGGASRRGGGSAPFLVHG